MRRLQDHLLLVQSLLGLHLGVVHREREEAVGSEALFMSDESREPLDESPS